MGDHRNAGHEKEVVVDDAGSVEWLDSFCYLGDVMGCGGGVEDAVRHRVKCAWGKFRELSPFLTLRGMSLKLKGKLYSACVQSVLMYGSETWALKVGVVQRMMSTEKNDGKMDVLGDPERPKIVTGVTGLHGYCVHM